MQLVKLLCLERSSKLSLWECLRHEFLNNSEFWNYYKSVVVDPFEDEVGAQEFIRGYFYSGCKENAVQEWISFDEIDLHFRDTHVIYVFFIGIMLQYIIDPQLKIESSYNDDEGYKFSYLWFLTCLAHDLGYVYECKNMSDERENLERMYNRFWEGRHVWSYRGRIPVYRKYYPEIRGVSPSIPLKNHRCFNVANMREPINRNHMSYGRICKGNLLYSNGTQISRCWYSVSIKERYFRYRLLHRGKLDHGIVGADKFFSDMVENYRKNFERSLTYGTFEYFVNCNDRCFCCEQFKIFAHVADCIAAHNIFKGEESEESIRLYEEYELQELLPANFVKISYSKNPLLFILCVADTLEPTKKFRNIDPSELMQNIEIDYDVEHNCIDLNISEWLSEQDGCEAYIKAVKELQKWCEVTVQVEEDND